MCVCVNLVCGIFLPEHTYTRSPLQDSRLFGPRPWKILAATYETNGFLSNPDPGENHVMENLVMETGCIILPEHTYSDVSQTRGGTRERPDEFLHDYIGNIYIYIYIYIYTHVCVYIYIHKHNVMLYYDI